MGPADVRGDTIRDAREVRTGARLERLAPALAAAAVLAVALVAVVARFYDLGAESYWYDELIMARLVEMDWGPLLREMAAETRPPLYVLLAKAWTGVFGTSEAGARSFSAVVGVLSVPLLYEVGRRLWGRGAGLAAALVMALSTFHVYYSQELRYYSLVMLLTTAVFLFFVRGIQGGRTRDWALFGLCSALLFYTHLLAVAVLAAPAAFLLLRRRRYAAAIRPWLLSQVGAGVAMTPWLVPALVRQIEALTTAAADQFGAGTWIPAPPLYAPARTLINFLILGRRYLPLEAAALGAGVLLTGVLVLVVLKGPRRWLREARPALDAERIDAVMLAALWLLVPIVALFLPSLVLQPFYVDRYVSTAAPALYLLAGMAVAGARRLVPPAAALAALAMWLGAATAVYHAELVKEQWREAAAYVEAHAGERDLVVLGVETGPEGGAEELHDNFYWYYDGEPSRCWLWRTREGAGALVEQIRACDPQGSALWVVMWEYEPEPFGIESYFTEGPVGGLHLAGMQAFKGVTVYRFDITQTEPGG